MYGERAAKEEKPVHSKLGGKVARRAEADGEVRKGGELRGIPRVRNVCGSGGVNGTTGVDGQGASPRPPHCMPAGISGANRPKSIAKPPSTQPGAK